MPEMILAIVLMITIYLPALHELFNVFDYVTAITNIFNNIFKIKHLMVYVSILEFISLAAVLTIDIINKIQLKKASATETKKVI